LRTKKGRIFGIFFYCKFNPFGYFLLEWYTKFSVSKDWKKEIRGKKDSIVHMYTLDKNEASNENISFI
jgi:hypothetical protein